MSSPQSTIKKKAFICISDWYETSMILFEESRNKAKWNFIKTECEGEFHVDISVRRAPGWDQYAEEEDVPSWELIGSGWWMECHHCGERIDEDNLRDRGLRYTDVVGTYKTRTFCNDECERDENAWQARKKQMTNRVVRRLMFRLEDRFGRENLEMVGHHVYFPRYTDTLKQAYVTVKIRPFDETCTYGITSNDVEPCTIQEFESIPRFNLSVPKKIIDAFRKIYDLKESFP